VSTKKLEAGDRLDQFEIVEHLGYGAFSDVYRARDGAGGDVVLKCPHEVILGDTATFDRFRREMKIAERLRHDGIQRSLDGHADRSRPYMVMEYVEGRTLREALKQDGVPPVERAVDIAGQVAGAMAYAHRQGVYHRDLKPENVLVTPSGRAVVTDFGIALMEGARRLTYRWFTSEMGTPDYMAPEQVQGKRGDARTDVYAIGVMLFEMLSGDVPWHGGDALTVMSQKLTAPPGRLPSAIPAGLQAVVRKCLRRNADERYQSAEELAADLERWRSLDLARFDFPPEATLKVAGQAGLWALIAGLSAGFLLLSAGAAYVYHLAVAAHG
jgi:serine/threonine protein kinase